MAAQGVTEPVAQVLSRDADVARSLANPDCVSPEFVIPSRTRVATRTRSLYSRSVRIFVRKLLKARTNRRRDCTELSRSGSLSARALSRHIRDPQYPDSGNTRARHCQVTTLTANADPAWPSGIDLVAEVRSLGRTLKSWRKEILAHHDTGASNGPTEGLNPRSPLRCVEPLCREPSSRTRRPSCANPEVGSAPG